MGKDEKDPNIFKDIQDPSFILLDTFRKECPGTFQHSKHVADICESIALSLKLDVDFLRVCALYHDIGKLNFPLAFSENQNGKNIHDGLEPWISYQLITRHVGDSLNILLRIEGLPSKVLRVISQHHGNTILRSIAGKVTDDVKNESFRYRCDKPNSLESAILMIVDSIEASARSIFTVTPEKNTLDGRRQLVDKTIDRLVDDNQLDNIKVGELKSITSVLYKELDSIYHGRETYPEKEIEGD